LDATTLDTMIEEFVTRAGTDYGTKEKLLDAMVAHPILIERPLVIRDGKRAVIGRPPENVDALL
jgi:arsenate reductase-like glutaredoxin family protein